MGHFLRQNGSAVYFRLLLCSTSIMGALLWSSHTVQNSCITPHRGYEFVKVLKERRDHPVLPNDPIHPINRRGRKNFCKEERKFKENPKINI